MRIPLFFLLFFTSCVSTKYYVVRHAEKEAPGPVMQSDVPLSEPGKQRAASLGSKLSDKKIKYIYSTNTIRTTSTAKPISQQTGNEISIYDPRDTGFIRRLKALPKGNVLIVGHSNTVDDIINALTGSKNMSDLPDTRYGDLFILKRTGKKVRLTKTESF